MILAYRVMRCGVTSYYILLGVLATCMILATISVYTILIAIDMAVCELMHSGHNPVDLERRRHKACEKNLGGQASISE